MNNALSADDVLKEAMSETRLDDFGDNQFLSNYRTAINALNAEVTFSETGLINFRAMVLNNLKNWLKIQRDLRQHPEILEQRLSPPVVVTGFVRSGTTKLQRMLSVGPGFQSLELWRVINPAPVAAPGANGEDPRIAITDAMVEAMREHYPEFFASHPLGTRNAEEDLALQELTFNAPSLPMSMGARRFKEQLAPIANEVYEFVKTCLKYFQWQDGQSPEQPGRPWVLKSPLHLGNLTTLCRVFPGGKIIHTHRDVLTSVTSCARLEELSSRRFTDSPDLTNIGDGVLSYWSKEWQRNIAQRQHIDSKACLDVQFDEINSNSMALMEKVYDFLGEDFDQPARRAVMEWESANERHKYGHNRYAKEDFGFTEERIRQAFTAYFDHFSPLGLI